MSSLLDPGQIIKLVADEANSALKVNIVATATGGNTVDIVSGDGSGNKATVTAGKAILVDSSATTQPVSGTVAVTQATGTNLHTVVDSGSITANIGTTGGLALDASITSMSAKLPATLGAHLTAASMAVNIASDQTVPVSAASLPLPTGASTSALQSSVQGPVAPGTAATNSTLIGGVYNATPPTLLTGQQASLQLDVDGSLFANIRDPLPAGTNSIGQVTANAGTGSFTVAQATGTNLHTVVDSGTVTANVGTTGGLALDASVAKLTIAQSAALGTNTQALVGGSVTTAAPTYTTGNINPLSLTTAGALRTDSSAVTQPVSGTVTANAGTGSFTVAQATAASLNATVVGTGTFAVQAAQSGTWSTTDTGYASANAPVYNDYTITPITTAAYVQLVASTTSTCNEIELFDSSGQALYLAIGAAASEVNQMIIVPGGNGRVRLRVAAGTRISAKAITANATVGFLTISFYG